VSLLDRLLDRHRFPVLPPHELAAQAPGEAPVVCRMIFEELCVLSTGEIVCSCGDPAGLAVYGNVHRDRVEEVFRGRRYRRMRRWQLAAAPGSFCPVVRSRCGGRVSRATALDTEGGRTIRVLQLEPTSRCNLRCPGCPVTNFHVDPAYRAGRTATLPLATMLHVVDQLPDLEKLLFYDFGEPFLHPEAVPFLREVRRRRPDVTIHTSTNGLALSAEAIAAVAGEALADRVVFSIDGASEATYRRYRRGGSFETARGALAVLAEACTRAGTRERVDVVWQYILFEWNDGDEEIARARALAAGAGARLAFVVTHTAGASRRYVDGSPETARLLAGGDPYEALTCDARMKHLWRHGGVAGDRWRAGLACRPRALSGPAGGRVALAVDVRNDGRLAWGETGPPVRLGLRLRTSGGRPLRELPGVALAPPALLPGTSVTLDADVPLPESPGLYELFVDVVEEGVCWFSDRGSAPLSLPLSVGPTG
jgi:pyruvate-formate lyase-activating enzyme